MYAKTSRERESIARNDGKKLGEEVAAVQRDLGLESMRPLRKRGLYEQLDDMRTEASHIREVMDYTHERNVRKKEEARKARRRSPRELLRMVLAQNERKSRQDYDRRRITFPGGGFEKYEGSLAMTSGRVLLKEVKAPEERGGVIVPHSHFEKFPRYSVVAFGDLCDGVSAGDVVLAEAYSGTEIVSGAAVYRIVFIGDILCRLEGLP